MPGPRKRLFYCDHHTFPLPAGHRFPARKYALLRAALEAGGSYELQPAPLAEAETIALAHDAEYVRQFLDGTVDPKIMRRIVFPWSQQLARRTLASVGGTLAAAADVLDTGFGGNLAGGTHHAHRAEGSGFCVFNDLAVATLALRREGRVRRAAVLDLDVHQGDGTASIFSGDADVLTISLHGENNFPFRKQSSRVDIGLPDGVGNEEYLRRLSDVLPELWSSGRRSYSTNRAWTGWLPTDSAGRRCRTRVLWSGIGRYSKSSSCTGFPLW